MQYSYSYLWTIKSYICLSAIYICPSAIYIHLSAIYICLSAIYICPSAIFILIFIFIFMRHYIIYLSERNIYPSERNIYLSERIHTIPHHSACARTPTFTMLKCLATKLYGKKWQCLKNPKLLKDIAFKQVSSSANVPKAVIAANVSRIKHHLEHKSWEDTSHIPLKICIKHQ